MAVKDVQLEASDVEGVSSAHALSLAILLVRGTDVAPEHDEAAEEATR